MSVRGKDFRCDLDPEIYEALRKMADAKNVTIQALGEEILSEGIAGKFHTESLKAKRIARSGMLRQGGGASRKVAESLQERAERLEND